MSEQVGFLLVIIPENKVWIQNKDEIVHTRDERSQPALAFLQLLFLLFTLDLGCCFNADNFKEFLDLGRGNERFS